LRRKIEVLEFECSELRKQLESVTSSFEGLNRELADLAKKVAMKEEAIVELELKYDKLRGELEDVSRERDRLREELNVAVLSVKRNEESSVVVTAKLREANDELLKKLAELKHDYDGNMGLD
jgi:chromosome segregation ATPase